MQTDDFHRSLPSLFSELVFGTPERGGFMLNRGDPGLLACVQRISAEQASVCPNQTSVAAHIRHVAYGLSLLNRWAAGESNPFQDANWAASWIPNEVSPLEWDELRTLLKAECKKWHAALQSDRKVAGIELDGVIGSVAHLAYHLGAIRQIQPLLRGPAAND